MRYIIVVFFILNSLNAIDVKLKSYNEYYDTQFSKSSLNSVFTLIQKENIATNYLVHYNISANILSIINKQNSYYDYLDDKYTLRSFSIDYYNINKAISFGRNYINLSLLKGSFDGIMYYHILDKFSFRFYYFNHFELLLPNYYIKNNEIDLKGININYTTEFNNIKLTYMRNNKDNFYHNYFVYLNSDINYIYQATYFNSKYLQNEYLYKLALKKDFTKSSFEFGIIKGSKNGISKILEFETENINVFGLENNIYFNESSNIYMEYIWLDKSMEISFLIGSTKYKQYNSTNSSNEFDIDIKYTLSSKSNIVSSVYYKQDTTNETLVNVSLEYKF